MDKGVSGFTLIELLIVVVILGILAGLVSPRLAGRTEWARVEAAKADISGGIAMALDLFELDTGRYPTSLEELIHRPQNLLQWRGPYFKRGFPRDPWGHPYIYRFPGIQNPEGYDLYSSGSDEQEGTADDIANWQED
ncbi:MAG: type II secretion system major pseudopilin GspG [Candidatus Omnitrophica bacterium]|nr:type II secretion system major pseudopilin GspG [Candidatus Omnitrophota bacterium]